MMLTHKYKVLVFDWDGTLVNSFGLFIDSLQRVAVDLHINMPDIKAIRAKFGLSLEVIATTLFPAIDIHIFYRHFYRYFTENKLATYFYAGAIETLQALKQQNYLLAIATNKPRKPLEEAINLANIADLFVTTRSVDDGFAKPHEQMLLNILEELDLQSSDALMIGDTTIDMQLAKNAKVDALAAIYGHHSKEQLSVYNPVTFLEDIRNLPELLVKMG